MFPGNRPRLGLNVSDACDSIPEDDNPRNLFNSDSPHCFSSSALDGSPPSVASSTNRAYSGLDTANSLSVKDINNTTKRTSTKNTIADSKLSRDQNLKFNRMGRSNVLADVKAALLLDIKEKGNLNLTSSEILETIANEQLGIFTNSNSFEQGTVTQSTRPQSLKHSNESKSKILPLGVEQREIKVKTLTDTTNSAQLGSLHKNDNDNHNSRKLDSDDAFYSDGNYYKNSSNKALTVVANELKGMATNPELPEHVASNTEHDTVKAVLHPKTRAINSPNKHSTAMVIRSSPSTQSVLDSKLEFKTQILKQNYDTFIDDTMSTTTSNKTVADCLDNEDITITLNDETLSCSNSASVSLSSSQSLDDLSSSYKIEEDTSTTILHSTPEVVSHDKFLYPTKSEYLKSLVHLDTKSDLSSATNFNKDTLNIPTFGMVTHNTDMLGRHSLRNDKLLLADGTSKVQVLTDSDSSITLRRISRQANLVQDEFHDIEESIFAPQIPHFISKEVSKQKHYSSDSFNMRDSLHCSADDHSLHFESEQLATDTNILLEPKEEPHLLQDQPSIEEDTQQSSESSPALAVNGIDLDMLSLLSEECVDSFSSSSSSSSSIDSSDDQPSDTNTCSVKVLKVSKILDSDEEFCTRSDIELRSLSDIDTYSIPHTSKLKGRHICRKCFRPFSTSSDSPFDKLNVQPCQCSAVQEGGSVGMSGYASDTSLYSNEGVHEASRYSILK